jgi:membrane protease YdiL (CAAX protease family)
VFLTQHIPLLCIFLFPIVAPTLPGLPQRLILQSLLAVYAIALLTSLDGWRTAGFNPPKQWRSLNLLWFPLLFFALCLVQSRQTIDGQTLAISLFAQSITGLSEEAIFRGVVLQALLPLGVMRSTLLTSLLFGLSHWARRLSGVPINSVLLMMFSATIDGVILGAVRLRTNTIWTANSVAFGWQCCGQYCKLARAKRRLAQYCRLNCTVALWSISASSV